MSSNPSSSISCIPGTSLIPNLGERHQARFRRECAVLQLLTIIGHIMIKIGIDKSKYRGLMYKATRLALTIDGRIFVLLQHLLEREWLKRYTVTNEMFAHCLYPVQTQTVQHGTSAFHNDQDYNTHEKPHIKCDNNHDYSKNAGLAEGVSQGHRPEHERKLLMSKGQRPQA
jgi:hypothetical protein